MNLKIRIYRAVVFFTVGKVLRGRELLPDDNSSSEQQSLSNAHHAASRVIQRQRSVEDVVVSETGHHVDGCRYEYESEKCALG